MGRLKVLKDLAAPIFARVREHRERPEALENLKTSLNNSHNFLIKSRGNTEKTGGEEGLFKEKELEMLEKKIADVEKWRDEKLAEQEATSLSEMPKLTVSMINMKVGDLESEIQYLIQKAKMKKAELDRAKRKAEEEAAKAEAAGRKQRKKKKRRKQRKQMTLDLLKNHLMKKVHPQNRHHQVETILIRNLQKKNLNLLLNLQRKVFS